MPDATLTARRDGGAAPGARPRPVILVGNPNVGKSVVFGALTGRYVTVSNFPGTTIEILRSTMPLDGGTVPVIDSPGTNSLTPLSEDEAVTRNIVLAEPRARFVQVADAKNLRRALLVTSQLAELDVDLTLCLNMDDEARSRGITIDAAALGRQLGIDVTRTVATEKRGIPELRSRIASARPASWSLDFGPEIEGSAARIAEILPATLPFPRRAIALLLLASEGGLDTFIEEQAGAAALAACLAVRQEAEATAGEPLRFLLHRLRLAAVDRLLEGIVTREGRNPGGFARWFGQAAMHPVLGLLILLAILAATWWIVGVFAAGYLVGLLEEGLFGGHINPAVTRLVQKLGSPFLERLLVGDFGLLTVAITYAFALILPIVTFFFLVFGLLEDSGYLPRLAVMVNRGFRIIGLNGRAVLPMVLGLGCDTMATMTTRILQTRRERIIATLLLALAVPCTAQMGVITFVMARNPLWVFIAWVAILLIILLGVGWMAARVVPGHTSDFVMEIPPIRRPRPGNLVVKTLARLEWYLKEAVPLFIIGTFAVFVLHEAGALTALERILEPVTVHWLGLPREVAAGFIAGFVRRDYAVAMMMAGTTGAETPIPLSPAQTLVAIVTITLFIPCIANFFVMIRERGLRTAAIQATFVMTFAFVFGGLLHQALRLLGVMP